MSGTAARYYAFVDWDDTLKVTNATYHAASARNAQLVLEKLPDCRLQLAEIEARVHALDLAKSRQYGLRQLNFPEAWVSVYEELAAACGQAADPVISNAIYKTAAEVPEAPQDDYPGARELLIALRDIGCEITIWTAGEQAVQERKIARSDFVALIDRVCVVPEKTPEALRSALGKRSPACSCVIGNSPRSDIAPALALGVRAIHVTQDTWAYDDAELDCDHPCYFKAASLAEALQTTLPLVFPSAFAERRQAPA